jgi:hypothetical protein
VGWKEGCRFGCERVCLRRAKVEDFKATLVLGEVDRMVRWIWLAGEQSFVELVRPSTGQLLPNSSIFSTFVCRKVARRGSFLLWTWFWVDLFGFGHGWVGIGFLFIRWFGQLFHKRPRRGLISLLLEASVEGKGPRASDFGRLV